MPTVPNSPSTEARTTLKTIIDAEYTDVGVKARMTKLNPSLGSDGAVVAIYPSGEVTDAHNGRVLVTQVVVQFFNRWDDDVDPTQSVDPAPIEALADRFRRATGAYQAAGDGNVWFFKVLRVTYPRDPTGNITRFEAIVNAHGDNPAF